MGSVRVAYGQTERTAVAPAGSVVGGAVAETGLPLEQPCAGRGTCLKCKLLCEGQLEPPDERELAGLTRAELQAGYRLACRARVAGDVTVTLAPTTVYSNKIFRASDDHLRRRDAPLGLAVDLGSTTVAAFVTTLDEGKVCAGAAALNQQTTFGADIISRMAAAQLGPETARRLSLLALSSIVQAVDALKLAARVRERVRKVTIVGNCAMHHLLLGLPVDTLAELPFQPWSAAPICFGSGAADNPFAGVFPEHASIALPPLIGGFVGSDALACLVCYGFDRAKEPMAAIDLGTNGEVMVTDGERILVGSTAAGPAFEGVNISCGARAIDGAIIRVRAGDNGNLALTTVGDQPPAGLTGSGLIDLVHALRTTGAVDAGGRLVADHPTLGERIDRDGAGISRFLITDHGMDRSGVDEGAPISLYLTQLDIRELQKAKGAIRAAFDTLLQQLGLAPGDLRRVILTGSFGSQLNADAVTELGMIPPAPRQVIEASPNGAGLGAALMLDDTEFGRAVRMVERVSQIDLDLDPDFNSRYVRSLALQP